MSQENTNLSIKARPMNKDEVNLLLELIVQKKIITTKATNASNNRLKEDAWKTIANEFSAQIGESRRPEQLRLKWENVKKAARKRSAAIRQNNLKTGGGKGYIPPDEVLDRVASMLGATCSGFTVEFGGDGVDSAQEDLPEVVLEPQPKQPESNIFVVMGDGSGVGTNGGGVSGEGNEPIAYVPRAVLFNTPKNSQNKRRKLSEELLQAQKEKECAMAAYFTAKAEKVQLENEKLKIEIEHLKKMPDA